MGKKKNKRSWNDWLRDAQAYYEAHRDFCIPTKYVTPEGYKLGRWIERQRAVYNGNSKITGVLYQNQIDSLNAIGMIWKIENRYTWSRWLEICDDYIKRNGKLRVQKNYQIDGVNLGNWIAEQRKKYKSGRLTAQQISDLNARNMEWSFVQRRTWEAWYNDAKEYYSLHGNLNAPLEYLTPEKEPLGKWVFGQRYNRIRQKNYSEERVRMLNAIGMIWELQDIRDKAWEQMYSCIKVYKEKYGKLPLWPKNQKAPDGRTMDGWISTQRSRLANNKAPDWQIQKLHEIGIFPYGDKKNNNQKT